MNCYVIFPLINLGYTISAPIVEMREKPSFDAEIVSQAYYSEKIQVLEEGDEWTKIETAADHYQGWVKNHPYQPHKEEQEQQSARVARCAAHLYHVKDTVYGPILTLPFESCLKVIEPKEESTSRWIKVSLVDGRIAYIQRGDVSLAEKPLNLEEVCTLSLQFLGLPYTWGGRSSFGYDCSGFIQMLYRQMGISLPRDAKEQAKWEGFKETSIEKLKRGDLIFFGYGVDKIRHVGLYLGNGQFIHPTAKENKPYIRISTLTDLEWSGFGEYSYRTFRTLDLLRNQND